MRKIFLIVFGLFITLFLVSCQQEPILPYIQAISPSQDLMAFNGNYELKFFVVNPTINTFIGNLTYKFDTNCLSMRDAQRSIYGNYEYTQGIQINPKSQSGVTKEFTYTTFDQYNRPTQPERPQCLQTPLKVTVSLFDAGGGFRGSQDFSVTITK